MDFILKCILVCLYIWSGSSAADIADHKDDYSPEENTPLHTDVHTNTVDLYPLLFRAYHSLQRERQTIVDLISTFKTSHDAEIQLLKAIVAANEHANRNTDENIMADMDKTGQRSDSQTQTTGENINPDIDDLKIRRKRSTFDSISHNSGFGRLGHAETGRRGKLAFTFKNLLPYLLDEHRRNNRASRRRRINKAPSQ